MYNHLTATELRRILSRTSEHSFSFNVQRLNTDRCLPVHSEPNLYDCTRHDASVIPFTQGFSDYVQTVKKIGTVGDVMYWQSCIFDHFSTPQEVRDGPGYRGFEILGFELLDRMKDHFMPNTDRNFWNNRITDFTRLLRFNNLCASNMAEAKKDLLVDIANWMAEMTITIRSEAMKYGIPLENVLEAVIGSKFEAEDPAAAIKSILFGLKPDTTDSKSIYFENADHQIGDTKINIHDNKF